MISFLLLKYSEIIKWFGGESIDLGIKCMKMLLCIYFIPMNYFRLSNFNRMSSSNTKFIHSEKKKIQNPLNNSLSL